MFGWFRKYVRKISVFGVEVEFQPLTENGAKTAATPSEGAIREEADKGRTQPSADDSIREESGGGRTQPPVDDGAGLTFDEVIQAIRAHYPEADLGQTAQQGNYYERARRLTNYHLHTSDPPWYGAVQPNGRTMWLYLGKGGKICCGDKD
jgi:hypothetical protein